MDKMKDLEVDDISRLDRDTNIENLFGKKPDDTDICSKNNIKIQNYISNVKREDMGNCDDDYDIGI